MAAQPGVTDLQRRPKAAPQLMAEPPSRGQQLVDLLWLVGVVFRSAGKPCLMLVASALLSGLLVPAQLWFTKTLVDALVARLAGSGESTAVMWLALLIGTLLLDRALSEVQPWLRAIAREEIGTNLQEQVIRKATRLDLASFEHQAYYDQLNRVAGDAERRGSQLLDHVLQLLNTVPKLIAYAVALVMIAPALFVTVLAAWVPTVVVFVFGGQSYWRVLQDQTRDRRLSEYYAGLLTQRNVAKGVRLFGLTEYLLQRWAGLFWETRNEQRRLAMRLAVRQRMWILGSTCVSMLGLWWVVASGLARASAGTFALLFQSVHGFIQGAFSLSGVCKELGEQSGYASEFRAFQQLPTEHEQDAPVSPGIGKTAGRPERPLRPFPSPLRQGIHFYDVWFTYPGSERPALAGVTFTLHAGEKLALVGENGAGKSTLVKLLLGLYRPDAGRITVDGIDLRELDQGSLRAAMSAVFQQFVRYQLSVGENVALGQPGSMDDRARLDRAVQKAGADEVVQRLPQGYETILGPDVGGVDLSGGQWQRVALARGFFRDAQVLVLDEPTAALDPQAELAVFERFAEMAAGRTALLISHRLGMARLADRILVLADGRVVEHGTHTALLRAGGPYAELFGLQARWYA